MLDSPTEGGEGLEPFRFAVLNDLHYTDGADRLWLGGLIDQVNATASAPGAAPVEICLVLGDLAELGTRAEMTAARDILRGLKMPTYNVPGNHDGPPGRAVGGPIDLALYEEFFPKQRNYTFEHRGWQFLALDSTDGSAYQDVRLRPEAKAYVQETLPRLDSRRPTILFTHFPVAPGVPYGLADGAELLAALRPLNLRAAFGGHYHGITEHVVNGTLCLTNRCCSLRREIHDGGTTRGYFLCTAHADGRIDWAFVEYLGPAL